MARMIRMRFIQVSVEEPKILVALIRHINIYRDPFRNFFERILVQIPLFKAIKEISKSIFNEIIFSISK